MMMYGAPESSVPESKISTMLGWRMAFEARASVKNRLTAAGSPARLACSTLMADRRPMPGWWARYTLPIPPSPSRDTTW